MIARLRLGAISEALLLLCASSTFSMASAGADVDQTFSGLTAPLATSFVDDFDGPAGQRPDPQLWNFQTGGGGWGNHEQQTYTADSANVRLDGDGHLIIEARDGAGQPTSARMTTDDKAALVFGVAAARIKLPRGQGLHPAFWMLGTSLDEVGYPGAGEIDIVEIVNDAAHAHFSVHGPMADGTKWKLSQDAVMPDLSEGFHTYWVAKQPGRLAIGVDEAMLASFDASELPTGGQWVQDAPFFALLNVAVAGEWPGPLGYGVLPAEMTVDWVKFWD